MGERCNPPEIVVLNLDRSPGRLADFLAHNPALGHVRRAVAVDGQRIDRARLRESGVIAGDLAYTDGALGNALSHITQWERAAMAGQPLTVVEDDAVLCGNFRAESARVMGGLPADWDLIMWGYNFDTALTFDLLPDVSACTATFDQATLRRQIGRFHAMRVTTTAYRLVCCLGIPGYSVSAAGAARLLAACVPLRQSASFYPGLNAWLADRSIEYRLNGLHAGLSSFVALPPLLVTANDHAISTVQPQRPGQQPSGQG